MRKSFVTTMPDKAGAFLRASELIAGRGGNIVRASYNKAVDLHMLFIEVEAEPECLDLIEKDLLDIGYLNEKITETRVIEVSVKIPDKAGAVLPALRILNRFDINISYIDSNSTDEAFQNFKMGLLIEDPGIIKTLLDEISAVYPIDIIQCETSEENLDNTVFYIRLANDIRKMFGLSNETTMQFIAESNRILQQLQAQGEDADRVFGYIRRFACFVSAHRGENFRPDIERVQLSGRVTLYSFQPPCGSNTYVFETSGAEELILMDSGFAIYAPEMARLFESMFPGFAERPKRMYITHADVDHCGLLASAKNARIFVNQKSAESFSRQARGLPDHREGTALHLGYSKISRIISGYTPPDVSRMELLDSGTPARHDDLLAIGKITVGEFPFTVYEGSGGHLRGEMIYVSEKAGLLFSGDLLVNISGFSRERREFNSLAPYLMKSVNVDSQKATQMRLQVLALAEEISRGKGRPCIICGGHGPLSLAQDGRLARLDGRS